MEDLLRYYLRKLATELPSDSEVWDTFDDIYVHAIRGGFRKFIRGMHLDPHVEDLIMEALTEDATN